MKKLLPSSLLLAFCSSVFANGYQTTTSLTNLGYGGMGHAALWDDPSYTYYNPAVTSQFCTPEITVVGALADSNPDAKFYDSTHSWLTDPTVVTTSGNNRETIGGWFPFVGCSAAIPLINNFSGGISVSVPWGLARSYTANAQSRYVAHYGKLMIMDIVPTLSYQYGDFAIGLGLDCTYTDVISKNKIAFGPLQAFDANLKNEGSGWAFGWNAGLLYNYHWCNNQCTHIGVSYHSKITTSPSGNAHFNPPPGFGAFSTPLTGTEHTHIILPQFVHCSIAHDVSSCLTLLGDVRWVNWNDVKNISLTYDAPMNALNDQLKLNWSNVLGYSLGLRYQPCNQWTFKFGYAYDQTPDCSQSTRTWLIPVNNMHMWGIGAKYHHNECFSAEIDYTLGVMSSTKIHQSIAKPPVYTAQTSGEVDLTANIFVLGFGWKFV